ncbi:putative transmembrane protein [Gregarina niphandrodes]|uniref:Transmembrane protein n=1 Tax=Gregarina niphandrodes TaxID=110365 RepID=A0A023B1Q8_GRENI|nr:putative transmembrane protein [Gregarina niphandrodes]EZG46462.1 putative transmembrane protein [Gregarina niphandrodes]|eukprot:XP_011132302.1 putative transmembrane protein [Gregarina niphandrodes]
MQAPQNAQDISKARNEIWWAGARTFMLNLFKFSPRINDRVICPSRRPSFALAYIWCAIALIHFATAWGHAYIESLPEEEFQQLSPQQRAVGFSVKTLPLATRLLLLWTGFMLQVIVLQVLLAPECNGISLQGGISLCCFIWLLVIALGIVSRTKTFITPYIYDPSHEEQPTLFTQIKQATKAIGP